MTTSSRRSCYSVRMIRSLLLATVIASGCASDRSSSSAGTSTSETPSHAAPTTDARKLIASGAVVIDVRTPEEFGGGHVVSATNIPVGELPARLSDVERLVKTDKSAPIVVYCASGRRSEKATQILRSAGYKNVLNGGGFDDVR